MPNTCIISGDTNNYAALVDSDGNLKVSSSGSAREAHLGEVGTPGDVFDVVLSTDTSIYADGEVLADLQEVTNFVRVNGGRALIQSMTLLDKDDQGVAMDIFISPSAVSLGSENSAPSISDANAVGLQNIRAAGKTYSIETADYKDLGGCRIATISGIGLLVEALGTSGHEKSMYVGAVTRDGTPTYTASGLTLRFGLLWL